MAGDLEFERPLTEIRAEIERLRKQRGGSQDMSALWTITELEQQLDEKTRETFAALTPWQRVQLARHPKRPRFLDFARVLFSDFVELHGDRRFGDDPALLGGLARFGEHSVVVLGQQKGRNARENVERNFGMPRPEGYRKALRLMKMAEKFGLPVMSFIDSGGASPALADEERGQAWSIAENLYEMSQLRVPILVTIIGEGCSGGALGIAVGDRVVMLEYSTYSVASPESCASIVWKDSAYAPDAAAAMRVTAPSLLELGLVDRIVDEPLGGAHCDAQRAAELLAVTLGEELAILTKIGEDVDDLLDSRYQRYRHMSRFIEVPA